MIYDADSGSGSDSGDENGDDGSRLCQLQLAIYVAVHIIIII